MNNTKLHRTLWRWHFYAGLFCIPFILSLSVTGAIYLFKPQIDTWLDRDVQQLSVQGQRSTPQAQIAAAIEQLPGSAFVSYRLPENPQQAVVVTLANEGKRILVYVDPYSQKVLKMKDHDTQFIRIVRTLHGELMLGNTGSVMIELAGCWAIVMIITGLYLWWPRNAKGMGGVLYPRLGEGGRRFWRDLHGVTGFWVSFFTLFLLISGLPWALVWGSVFKEIRSFGAPPVEQSWQISHAEHHSMSSNAGTEALVLTPAVLQSAESMQFAHPLELLPDRNNPTQWKLSSGHQNRMLRADAWLSADGKLLKQTAFTDRTTLDKAIGIGISAHEGHLFGWFNQLMGLLVAIGLCLVSVSGFILWRKRKPQGKLGAPAALPDARLSRTVLWITLVLAILLPVLAMSLIVLLCIEQLVLKRIRPARLWLGLS